MLATCRISTDTLQELHSLLIMHYIARVYILTHINFNSSHSHQECRDVQCTTLLVRGKEYAFPANHKLNYEY